MRTSASALSAQSPLTESAWAQLSQDIVSVETHLLRDDKDPLKQLDLLEIVRELEVVPIKGVVGPSIVLDVPRNLFGNEIIDIPHKFLAFGDTRLYSVVQLPSR